VYITLNRPKDAGKLDEAPVRVQITTDGVKNALTVPVTALMGRAGGGYVVEVADPAGGQRRRLVPVTLGMFDNDNGLVQVSGDLSAGDQVVVPAS
jgi:multidrug efflux pump subunit AcrA (membrane-fusion protein)